jgi:hypothetical protein
MEVELVEIVPPQKPGDPSDLFGLDKVLVNGKRVAFCPHCEGAVVRFDRLPDPSQAEAVRAEVARIRQEAGRWPISDRTMQPPDPRSILAFEGKRRKAAKR